MKRFLTILIKVILVLMIIGIIAGIGTFGYIAFTAEKINPHNIYKDMEQNSYIYDSDGKKIETIHYGQNRNIISNKDIPETLKSAFIAVEDKTFYKHHGLNFKRIIGAIVSSVRNDSAISGTSTITQQLARNVYLTDTMSERSLKRKATEVWYALVIEKELSKDEILEAYLNTVYFGYGCYGIDTASRTYFSKPVNKLNATECAALAALPQAPDAYALLTNEGGEHRTKIKDGLYANDISKDRRYLILDLMQEQGLIENADKYKKPLKDFIKPSYSHSSSKYTYFKDYLISEVSKDLQQKYSLTKEEADTMVYTGGLKIYSTIDSKAQGVVVDTFKNDYLFPRSRSGKKTEAAMVITDVSTGKIKAMVGGRNSLGEMLFNRATSPRQPGSTIKPLSVYSAALQKSYDYAKRGSTFPFANYGIDRQGAYGWGNYITAGSRVIDERTYINNQAWPNNATGYFSGYNTLRTALQRSINTCAVKIQMQVGCDDSIKILKKYGVKNVVSDVDETYNDVNAAALALGGMVHGISPLEESLAYATFPNGGVRNSAVCYNKVVDSSGKVILKGKAEKTKVLDEGVAWIMNDMLQSVVTRGIARNAYISGVPVGGKTGTTNDECDLWFSGFTPKNSAALWVGTDDNSVMYGTSAQIAGLWARIMSQIDNKGSFKAKPENVIYQYGEYYTKGTEPYRTY